MKRKVKRKITIEITGKTEGDLELALEVATAEINKGYVEGFNGDDDSNYVFKVVKQDD